MSENYPDVDDDGRVPSEFGKPVEKEYCDYCKEVLAINKQLEQENAKLVAIIQEAIAKQAREK